MYKEPGRAPHNNAAALALVRPSSRSVGVPARFVAKANDESSWPYRVTGRVTSWFERTHVAGAPTGACAARVVSIDPLRLAASHGWTRKSKLNAVCSSSGDRKSTR